MAAIIYYLISLGRKWQDRIRKNSQKLLQFLIGRTVQYLFKNKYINIDTKPKYTSSIGRSSRFEYDLVQI